MQDLINRFVTALRTLAGNHNLGPGIWTQLSGPTNVTFSNALDPPVSLMDWTIVVYHSVWP